MNIKTTSKEVKELAKIAYPEYKGRKFYVTTNIPQTVDSYWDGGSKDFYAFINLATKKVYNLPSNHPYYEKNRPRELEGILPEGIAIVRRSVFMGKESGITVIVNKKDLNDRLLESKEQQR